MSAFDTDELLTLIASHDDREVDQLVHAFWGDQAVRGRWTPAGARDAVTAFYAQNPPACWAGTDTPRPVLPADITRHMLGGDQS